MLQLLGYVVVSFLAIVLVDRFSFRFEREKIQFWKKSLSDLVTVHTYIYHVLHSGCPIEISTNQTILIICHIASP